MDLGLIASLEGDTTLARDQYGVLETMPSGFGVLHYGASADRILGVVAQAAEELHRADTHFEDALVFCRTAGYWPELAWTCCDYADLLLERDEAGDQEKATSLLDEGLAISRDLGMRPLMERILSRREILKA
jgi:hypothetical protein